MKKPQIGLCKLISTKRNALYTGYTKTSIFTEKKERSADMSHDDKLTFLIKVVWLDMFQNLLYMVPGMPKPVMMIKFVKKKLILNIKLKRYINVTS